MPQDTGFSALFLKVLTQMLPWLEGPAAEGGPLHAQLKLFTSQFSARRRISDGERWAVLQRAGHGGRRGCRSHTRSPQCAVGSCSWRRPWRSVGTWRWSAPPCGPSSLLSRPGPRVTRSQNSSAKVPQAPASWHQAPLRGLQSAVPGTRLDSLGPRAQHLHILAWGDLALSSRSAPRPGRGAVASPGGAVGCLVRFCGRGAGLQAHHGGELLAVAGWGGPGPRRARRW